MWKELSQEKASYFFEFVRAFHSLNPTETLLILRDRIEQENKVVVDISSIDTEKGKKNISVNNDIIVILGEFADKPDLLTALDLFFQYYLKRQDLYIQFYHAANQYYGIRKDSLLYGCDTQIKFFEKAKEHSLNWTVEYINILFIEVAKFFLQLYFTPSERGRKNTFVFYQVPISLSEGVEKYRTLIWKALSSLCQIDKYREKVRTILESYGGQIGDENLSVLQSDWLYIKAIMESYFPPIDLRNCILAEKLTSLFSRRDLSYDSL